MQVKTIENDVFVSDLNCLDLDLTLDCGQAFRWEKESDDSWSGVAGGHYLNIVQKGNTFLFKNTTMEVFENFWYNYFSLDVDYVEICEKLKEDKLIKSTIEEYYGIRILNQDSFEALFSFVISQQNNIKRIKLIIKRLCEKYGQNIDGTHYTFPTPEVLSKLTVKDFEELGTGYRAKYLEKLAKDVANGNINLEEIKKMSLDDARSELMKIYGVGIKVANCSLLFGLGFIDAFPIDVWMKRVMEYYKDGLPECFDGVRGIAQQYLFHWARNNL